ncbi:DUF4252 domain-containing protein [Prevotella sp. OH937_COT-195]|uniref:DUF4252 domain-containing protein n=1 Tax=Prevotella sp. OH937_COT-195 TaxID=2491051 RepID=UPI000F64F06B|nr:DUF4252 domain-containing protein [Prevotella sp. OH937_COT-195]RRC98463.1 DUF4252 domain-containing protein [Prevotella sp. OH937_COT-195]
MKKLFVTLVVVLTVMPMAAQTLQNFIDKYSAQKGAQVVNLSGEMLKNGYMRDGIDIDDMDLVPKNMKCDSITVVNIKNVPRLLKKFIKDAQKLDLTAEGYSEMVNVLDDDDYSRILIKGNGTEAKEMLIMTTDDDDNSIALVRIIGKIGLENMIDN